MKKGSPNIMRLPSVMFGIYVKLCAFDGFHVPRQFFLDDR